MKINRKIVAIIIFIIILLLVGIIIGKKFSTEKGEITTAKEKTIIKNVDKSEDKSENKVDNFNQEEKVENDELIEETEKTTSEHNSFSNNNNSSSTSNVTQNTTDSNINNDTVQESVESNTINSTVQPPPEISVPQTEWEKLGISEYDYYHTPMNNGEEVAFEGDTSICTAEINRLVNKYFKDGLSGGNSYTVNGKYTYSYIGCGINIFINGVSYTYSQVKAMGYN